MPRRKKKSRKQAQPMTAKVRPAPVAAAAVEEPSARQGPSGRLDRLLADGDRTRFLWAVILFLLAPIAILASQALPHTYYFGELGFLFPFTVYDVAMAVLGLGVLCAGFGEERRFWTIVGLFVATLLILLSSFVSLWQAFFLPNGLDEQIYLVTPVAVGLCGVSLWLPEKVRYPAALALSVLLAFDIALFIGLNEFAHDINTFTIGALLAASWILVAPAFLLRRFRRPWLTIAGRILGSWLVAIELLIFTFAMVPMPANG